MRIHDHSHLIDIYMLMAAWALACGLIDDVIRVFRNKRPMYVASFFLAVCWPISLLIGLVGVIHFSAQWLRAKFSKKQTVGGA